MMKAKIKQFKTELVLINEKVLVTFSFFFFFAEVSLVRNQICIFSKNGCLTSKKRCEMIMIQKGGDKI